MDQLKILSDWLKHQGVPHGLHDNYIEISQSAPCLCTYTIAMWSGDPSIPVMYLNVLIEDSDQSGFDMTRPASAEEVRDKGIVTPEFASWLSVTDHPITGLPTLFIHPCRTQDWMEQFSTEKLELWLQYFGQGVGLELTPS